jgi:hypothetical protein
MSRRGKLKSNRKGRPLCFVIGPIGAEATTQRRHSDLLLNALIRPALEKLGYIVKRADEDADPGMIADRAVEDIRHADLVIADLTDLNPNAFYELGVRHSTPRPTIHIARQGTVLPFDNTGHRTIFFDLTDWHSIQSASERLTHSVRAIQRPGFRISNPVVNARRRHKRGNRGSDRHNVHPG